MLTILLARYRWLLLLTLFGVAVGCGVYLGRTEDPLLLFACGATAAARLLRPTAWRRWEIQNPNGTKASGLLIGAILAGIIFWLRIDFATVTLAFVGTTALLMLGELLLNSWRERRIMRLAFEVDESLDSRVARKLQRYVRFPYMGYLAASTVASLRARAGDVNARNTLQEAIIPPNDFYEMLRTYDEMWVAAVLGHHGYQEQRERARSIARELEAHYQVTALESGFDLQFAKLWGQHDEIDQLVAERLELYDNGDPRFEAAREFYPTRDDYEAYLRSDPLLLLKDMPMRDVDFTGHEINRLFGQRPIHQTRPLADRLHQP